MSKTYMCFVFYLPITKATIVKKINNGVFWKYK